MITFREFLQEATKKCSADTICKIAMENLGDIKKYGFDLLKDGDSKGKIIEEARDAFTDTFWAPFKPFFKRCGVSILFDAKDVEGLKKIEVPRGMNAVRVSNEYLVAEYFTYLAHDVKHLEIIIKKFEDELEGNKKVGEIRKTWDSWVDKHYSKVKKICEPFLSELNR